MEKCHKQSFLNLQALWMYITFKYRHIQKLKKAFIIYRSVNINEVKTGGLRISWRVKVANMYKPACHACVCTHMVTCASMIHVIYMQKGMHTCTRAHTHTHAQAKKLIAACFTQKENTFQFLFTFIQWRIMSVNASKYAHTKNLELDDMY